MSTFRALRRPEYTGDNRCLPCTVLNVAIVAVVSSLAWTVSPAGAVAIAAAGVALVALRGYVVPYTPQFAPRLAEHLPVDFGHDARSDESDSLAVETDHDPGEILAALEEAGVVTGDAELDLAPDFRDAWEERMRERRTDDTETIAAAAAAAAPFPAEGSTSGNLIIIDGGRRAHLNRPVAIAEVAAIAVLSEWDVAERYRPAGADALRLFLRDCPDCGGAVVESTVGDCCGGGSSREAVLACEDCRSTLYKLPQSE